MGATNIEWTDHVWNPIIGCSIVSPGCTNCYAMKMAARIEKMQPESHYAGTTKRVNGNAVWTGKVALAPDHILTAPLRWTKPRRIFVNSMGDLFHEAIPDAWIDKVFAVMALCPQHTFQVLTKRAKRMREYVIELAEDQQDCRLEAICDAAVALTGSPCAAHVEDAEMPPRNVWLGVSAEDQTRADERIPDLLATPAAVRFVSAEPLLGPIDFRGAKLSWTIVGGESGSGARVWPGFEDACHSIRDQCRAAGVAFFMKQMAGTVKSKMPPIPGNLMIREFPK